MLLPPLNQRIKDLIGAECNGNISVFARKLGLDSSQIINRLFKIDKRSGKYPTPSTDILTKISNAFEISFDELVKKKTEYITKVDDALESFVKEPDVGFAAEKEKDVVTRILDQNEKLMNLIFQLKSEHKEENDRHKTEVDRLYAIQEKNADTINYLTKKEERAPGSKKAG